MSDVVVTLGGLACLFLDKPVLAEPSRDNTTLGRTYSQRLGADFSCLLSVLIYSNDKKKKEEKERR
jgi:hypothetical protein